MPSIKVRINYGLSLLNSTSSEFGGARVLLNDGSDRRLEWLGFISESEARLIRNARPVKIAAEFISIDEHCVNYQALKDNEYVQGCLIPEGGTYGDAVYGVLHTQIKVVTKPKP